ncbi:MAG: hypothetical protein R2875_14065 [Desulfobacterales bacterium]
MQTVLPLALKGFLEIITEATVRLQTIPKIKTNVSVRFTKEDSGYEAVRLISQSGLYPANCRLISPVESLSMGIGTGCESVLILGFESHDHPQDGKL